MVGVFHEGAGELLGMVSRAAYGLQNKGDKVKLDLLGSLGHVTGAGFGCGNQARAGRVRGDNGDTYERGGAVLIKHKVDAGVFKPGCSPHGRDLERFADREETERHTERHRKTERTRETETASEHHDAREV